MSKPSVKELLKTFDRTAEVPYEKLKYQERPHVEASDELVMDFYKQRGECGDTPKVSSKNEKRTSCWYLVELLNKRDDIVVIENRGNEGLIEAAYTHFKGVKPLGLAIDETPTFYIFTDMGENELKSAFKDTTRIAKRERAKLDDLDR